MRLRVHTASGQVLIVSLLVLGFLTLSFILIGTISLGDNAQVSVVMENKALADAAAAGCMEQAMDRLGLNISYAGNETLTVASSTCAVRPVIVGVGTWTIETWAHVGDQYTRYRTILTSRTPITINTWTEIAAF